MTKNHTHDNNYADVISYFDFYPSQALAIVALCLFFLGGVAVSVVTVKTRAHFMWICTFFCALEVAGFGCRLSMLQKASYAGYVSMQVFLVVAPTFLALINYVITGRLVQFATGSKRRHRAVAWFFFGSDILALAIQGAGAGISTSSTGVSTSSTGKNSLLAGLAIQIGFFVLFTILTIYIHVRPKYGLYRIPQLKPVFALLYSTIILLFTRNIYRVIEFSGGWYSRLAIHEKYFYCLDSLLMIFAVTIYTVLHPGFFMIKSEVRRSPGSSQTLPPPGKPVSKDLEMAASAS